MQWYCAGGKVDVRVYAGMWSDGEGCGYFLIKLAASARSSGRFGLEWWCSLRLLLWEAEAGREAAHVAVGARSPLRSLWAVVKVTDTSLKKDTVAACSPPAFSLDERLIWRRPT